MNATILIVDDAPEILRLLRVVLEKDGYVVVETDSGLGVESLVAESSPDLVLLDVMLPDRNGYEVCRSLKMNPGSLHIPILMLTALRGRAEEARALAAGADDFMSKPVDREQLLGRVRAHLRVKRLYSEVAASRREVERLTLELAERTAERDRALLLPRLSNVTADRELQRPVSIKVSGSTRQPGPTVRC